MLTAEDEFRPFSGYLMRLMFVSGGRERQWVQELGFKHRNADLCLTLSEFFIALRSTTDNVFCICIAMRYFN
jgi:hypothetical protein